MVAELFRRNPWPQLQRRRAQTCRVAFGLLPGHAPAREGVACLAKLVRNLSFASCGLRGFSTIQHADILQCGLWVGKNTNQNQDKVECGLWRWLLSCSGAIPGRRRAQTCRAAFGLLSGHAPGSRGGRGQFHLQFLFQGMGLQNAASLIILMTFAFVYCSSGAPTC